jgi:hypothetical protein
MPAMASAATGYAHCADPLVFGMAGPAAEVFGFSEKNSWRACVCVSTLAVPFAEFPHLGHSSSHARLGAGAPGSVGSWAQLVRYPRLVGVDLDEDAIDLDGDHAAVLAVVVHHVTQIVGLVAPDQQARSSTPSG